MACLRDGPLKSMDCPYRPVPITIWTIGNQVGRIFVFPNWQRRTGGMYVGHPQECPDPDNESVGLWDKQLYKAKCYKSKSETYNWNPIWCKTIVCSNAF